MFCCYQWYLSKQCPSALQSNLSVSNSLQLLTSSTILSRKIFQSVMWLIEIFCAKYNGVIHGVRINRNIYKYIKTNKYYNNNIELMKFTLFHPDFKQNVRAAPIRAVDVYNVMCRTLGVEPLPNNGSWSRVEYLLNSTTGPSLPINLWLYCVFLGILSLWN